MLAGSGRPRKACNQCKGQKVRCSGERPNCKRCARLKRDCSYTHSTSSEHGTTSQKPAVRSPRKDTSDNIQRNHGVSSGAQRSPLAVRPSFYEDPLTRLPTQENYLGIPAGLLSSLVDVFYSHIYNASLLLHRSLFTESLAQGTARPHLVLSVCAFAGVFYRDANDQSSLLDNGFCVEWAERAGKLVLQELETPHEDNLVTCLNLALFWYGRGAWQRGYVFKGNASLMVYLLGLCNEGPRECSPLQREILRRRFWANYLMSCHATESTITQEPSEATLRLTLPWREEDFQTGTPSEQRVCLNSNSGSESIYGEMVHSLTLWQEVWNLIRAPNLSGAARLCAIYDLDARISTWWSRVPIHYQLTASNISSIADGILPKLLLINMVRLQCLTAIHASIIPLFSWGPDEETSPTARRLSATVAYENACKASDLFQLILESGSDLSAIPSFVAYAAYSGCAIHIPFLWCSEQQVQERAYANLRTNAKIIHALKKYWKFAALLETHLRHLYKMHAKDPIPLDNEPTYLDVEKLKKLRNHARRARESILGHNRILWTKESGFTKQGEEAIDLGVEEESNDNRFTTPLREDIRPRSQPAGATSILADGRGEAQNQQQSFDPTFAPNRASSGTQVGDIYSPPAEPIDFFHPFLDPEMLDIFPDGDLMDFAQFDTSPTNLSFLDCWIPDLDAGLPGL